MSTPSIGAKIQGHTQNLKLDLLNAAKHLSESQSPEQLEDALRSIDYFLSLIRNKEQPKSMADSRNWPVGCGLICIAKDSEAGLYLGERYVLAENEQDSSLIIVDYKGEKRYQLRSNFKLS